MGRYITQFQGKGRLLYRRTATVWRKYIKFPIVRVQIPINRRGAPGIKTANRAEINTPTKTTRCSTSRSCRKRGNQMVRQEFVLTAKWPPEEGATLTQLTVKVS